MHQETLTYIIHQLAYDRKHASRASTKITTFRRQRCVGVAAGTATLGVEPDEIPFGWDNEFRRTEVAVAAFEIDEYPVTNGAMVALRRRRRPAAGLLARARRRVVPADCL